MSHIDMGDLEISYQIKYWSILYQYFSNPFHCAFIKIHPFIPYVSPKELHIAFIRNFIDVLQLQIEGLLGID